jgi:hypothetical protein
MWKSVKDVVGMMIVVMVEKGNEKGRFWAAI